jgi:hypothetical protein
MLDRSTQRGADLNEVGRRLCLCGLSPRKGADGTGAPDPLVPIRTKTGTQAGCSTTVGESTTSYPDSPAPTEDDLTSTQTPRPPAPPQRPATSPTQLRFRPLLTGLSVVGIIASAFYLAFTIGTGRQIIAAALMVTGSLALAVASQRPGFYAWADSSARRRDSDLVVEHADQAPPAAGKVPKQRRSRRTQPDPEKVQVPTMKPSWDLGAEFRYIILFGRHLIEKGPAALAAMDRFWKGIDWESETTESEYRDVVEFLYDRVRELPSYKENVKQEQLLAGDESLADNPFVFLAEVESYHPMIGATAALMLVRSRQWVTLDDFDVVMAPWTRLRLPYRLDDTIFKADRNGDYHGEEAPVRPPATPGTAVAPAVDTGNGLARPSGSLDEAIAAHTATPAPAAPAGPESVPWDLTPDDAPAPRRVEPDRDDVEDPDGDLIVHAAELVIVGRFGSTKMIQRKLRIGFSLALKVMHRLHVLGVVGPHRADGGARDVVVPVEELEETLDFIREEEAQRRHQ